MAYNVGDRVFNYTLTDSFLVNDGPKRRTAFKAQCVCGSTRIIRRDRLPTWRTEHCGCLNKGKQKKSRLYMIWCSMRYRCTTESSTQYKNYGARGIKVCERWMNSFQAFKDDMGVRPPGTSLDRIDNNGDYEPSNCRWATREQQANNTRRNVFLTYKGQSYTQSQLARTLGVSCKTIVRRFRQNHAIC